MTGWLLRRSIDALLTAAVAVVVLIVLLHLLPGDPLFAILGDRPAEPGVVAALRERYSLSLPHAIASFFGGLVHGDLGISLSEQRPVVAVVGERLPPTLVLAGLTLLIDFTVGLALGVWSALHPDSIRARFLGAVTLIGYTLPSFVVGLVLVWVFAVKLAWFPTGGTSELLLPADAPAATVLLDHLKHLVLPLATMVIATLAVPLRQQRTAALVTAAQPWVLAARARGLRPGAVAWRHCWRPALTPIVTLFGLWLPMLVAGAVFVEVVFAWPGIGSLLAHATSARDVPLVLGAGLVLIVAVQLGSLLADVMYRVVDPGQRPT